MIGGIAIAGTVFVTAVLIVFVAYLQERHGGR
jgi:hypothetical protein